MAASYSLHIGLNNVDPVHYQGWDGRLCCCENDALFYEDVAKKAGFTKSTLMLTSGANASLAPDSKNLNHLLDQYSGILNEGDFLFITYSGHGGTLQDFNFDEPDSQDETWCLYDRQYIDDELWQRFSKFRKGVRILLVSDSCHSGSVAKGIDDDNDANQQQQDPVKINLLTRDVPRSVTYKTYMANRDIYLDIVKGPVIERSEIVASVLLLAACQDDEKAAECDGFGLFTGIFKKVLENDKRISSYEQLFERIKTEMPTSQHPNIISYGSDMQLFLHDKLRFITGHS